MPLLTRGLLHHDWLILFGDDSPLYGAMGFVRKSERKSGLTKGKHPSLHYLTEPSVDSVSMWDTINAVGKTMTDRTFEPILVDRDLTKEERELTKWILEHGEP